MLNFDAVRLNSGCWYKPSEGNLNTLFSIDFHTLLMENDYTRKKGFCIRLTLENDIENFINLFQSLIVLEESREELVPTFGEVTLANFGNESL